MDETSYISCACNRLPCSADWGKNGLVCYGASDSVAIYDPEFRKIGRVSQTLHGHKARVNVVRWLRRNEENETELLSASSDGTAIIWTSQGKSYNSTSINDGHPVTIADGVYLRGNSHKNSELLLCTGNIEGSFVFWHRDSNKTIKKLQDLTFGRKIPTVGGLSFLPRSDDPLAVIALDDCSMQIYCMDISQEEWKFVHVQTLQNHEDWIRCMDFTDDSLGNLHLVTGSQDSSICLWKIYPDEMDDQEQRKNESERRIKRFALKESKYAVTLESLLTGHEHWVYGVHWHPRVFSEDGKCITPLSLLSCGMDKSMIVWEANLEDGGIWREVVRVGEVGGHSLGFYGCRFAPDGLSIMAHSFQGSFHLWRYDRKEKICSSRTGPTGHFSGVVDLCWDPKGRFLVTASLDQTTRVHAPWKTESGPVWYEIGRPQVHGYDMSCLAMLGPYTFASGAQEKVVRVFTAPMTFQKYLSKVANTDDWDGKCTEEASVPALGLTNKSVFDDNAENDNRDLDFTRLPTEEELIRHTLWPELQKLYGHGYEIFSMSSKSDGTRLATAAKSTTAEESAIIIWCTRSWSMVQKIAAHRLTVTQLAFSPDDSHLVSVSRDRRFVLHRCQENGDYEIVATSAKTNPLHARIIWCCAWSHDSKYFATGSRDGKIGIWSVDPQKVEKGEFAASLTIKDSSITALAFAPRSCSDNSYIIAVGHETGEIDIRKIVFFEDKTEWRTYARFDTSRAHHSTVKRLAFRPDSPELSTSKIIQLASCGMDSAVKIHDLCINDLESL